MKRFLVLFLLVHLSLTAQIPDGKKVVSSLYVYTLETASSKLILKENRHFEAPNWSPDGSFLLINSNGQLEKIGLDGKNLGFLNTGKVKQANNDHGYSFDGQTLFLSSGKPNGKGGSYIYRVPANGGNPIQITPLSPSYWHGVSPDGNWIVYCAERNDNYDVYKMHVDGGPEIRLTFSKGLDDGPEYSPDGKYIYFNSYRTGTMQIWRMYPDGSNPEQMTFDDRSNWFAHISPDSKVATIITYISDQGQNHPFGKRVKLRLLDLETKRVIDLTEEFYGGQGTINVPSWSPNGKRFAYVKYGLENSN